MIEHDGDPDESSSMDSRKGIFAKIFGPWTFFLLLLAGLAYLFLRPAEEHVDETPEQRQPMAVEIAPAAVTTLQETVRGIGSVRPVRHVEIKPEAAGRIRKVYFEEGSFVRQGKLLFEIEEEKHRQRLKSSQAALEQARVRFENSRRSYDRFRELFEQDLISENEFDQVRTEMDAVSAEIARLTAQVRLSQEDLVDTLIKAPFSGYISQRVVDPGQFVSTGQILAAMYQTDRLEISFTVPEKYSAEVKLGQEVLIEVSAHQGHKFSGMVSYVSPSVHESSRSLEIKASISNEQNILRPGSFASVILVLGYRDGALIIPERSLVATRDGYLVFVYDRDSEEVKSRVVRTGTRMPGAVEILQGLVPGDMVVVSGHMNLNHGMRVRVIEESGPDWAEDIKVSGGSFNSPRKVS